MNFSTNLSRSKTRIVALIAAALLCMMTLLGVNSASAHDELVATTPTQGAVLESSPKEFVLTFSGALKQIGTIIKLQDANGESVETAFTIVGRDLTVTPVAALPNGEYSLVTRVVSSDGHPIDKKLEFSVKNSQAVTSAEPTPAANQAPSAEPTAQATAAPVAPEEAKTFMGLPTGVIWALVGVVVLGSVAMVLAKTRRTGK
ncbi:hypothetical protein CQ018_03835 [Arthrobacter sp. MYb227]|uniref:copper resistance CopC family protein n=1 Tax=Arthrobacter sp. MYb227 TaxID=1848601 RepID=UPI000CFE2397|nr:copper resistance protein CopC [Arthrobacter sp. MYb227]PQZ96394.1 hypothetical protein CQ018_03835 [Arthrobacter sp. MYb227]